MNKYASNTEVPADRSRAEIEKTLQRYGADSFMYGWQGTRAVVQFECNNRRIKFVVEMPDKNDKNFTHHSRGRRTEEAALKAWEQATRQKWRSLALLIKAKLVAVDDGIKTFEQEFMDSIVLPNGQTVAEYSIPQIAQIYESGKMLPLLPRLN